MTGAPRQASPRGRDPRIHGDPTLFARLSLLLVTALGLLVQGLVVPEAGAQEVRTVRMGRFEADAADTLRDVDRDSLAGQIEFYSRMIQSMRDSLKVGEDVEITEDQRLRFEGSIEELSEVIESISAQLSDLEFQIEDNTISLLDEAGDGIIIRIPENLDEHLSKGLEAVTEMVLQEFPDTLRIDGDEHRWVWPGAREKRAPRHRRLVDGDVVKVGDDLLVAAEEDVRGNVVVVFGSAEVMGRVDGNVVVVFGDLRLDEAAEVTGKVVAVGGRLDQDRGARAGDVVVVDPLGGRRNLRPAAFMDQGFQGFLFCQLLFLLMLAVALVAAVAAPPERFGSVLGLLRSQPGTATGVGVLTTVGVHLVVIVLVGVLVLTVIGLPLALLLAVAMLVAGVIATAVVAAAVGERICTRTEGCPTRWAAVLVGMLVLHALSFLGSLLGLVPALQGLALALSVLGATVKILAYMAGVGALALSRFGTATPSS